MRTRMFAIVVALTVLDGSAWGLDITGCNSFVPEGETGVLQADLVCADGQYAVYLDPHATLQMNGHSMVPVPELAGLSDGIGCDADCSVIGPGEIAGFEYAVSTNGGKVHVSDLYVHDCEGGIQGTRIKAENVTSNHNEEYGFVGESFRGEGIVANDNGEDGFYVKRFVGENVTVNHNGEHGIVVIGSLRASDIVLQDNGGAAVVGGRVRAARVLATGNTEGGVYGTTVSIRDSTMTGNGPYDLGSMKFPKLIGSTCDHSVNWGMSALNWGVCSQD